MYICCILCGLYYLILFCVDFFFFCNICCGHSSQSNSLLTHSWSYLYANITPVRSFTPSAKLRTVFPCCQAHSYVKYWGIPYISAKLISLIYTHSLCHIYSENTLAYNTIQKFGVGMISFMMLFRALFIHVKTIQLWKMICFKLNIF